MCGISGFIDRIGGREERHRILQQMTEALAHRGPNDRGLWQSPDGSVNLGHRRLSIIDLSQSGHQPMSTLDGRYTIVFNGEIYNFQDLRVELTALGRVFRGASDTEVLLQAIGCWGLAATLPKLNGMFAFALWDAQEKKLSLARDRFGEKPLYYGWHGGVLFFGSELKSLQAHPRFQREISPEAHTLYMRFNYVPAPYCIFKNTWKLQAGHYIILANEEKPGPSVPYWRLQDLTDNRRLINFATDDSALIPMLDAHLRRAIKMRMVSDVPLGAFLSGGVDSSIVVALMQIQSTRPIKTFTIGFHETAYNEAEDAARVAKYLGTEHHEFYVSSRECMDVIPRLPQIYDEPFADSSQIPTALVSQFTRKHVTVALSGDGGDEFWGGYNRYLWSRRLWPKLQKLPLYARQDIAAIIQDRSPSQWDKLIAWANRVVPARLRIRNGGEKLHKLATAMEAGSIDDLYLSFVSQWQRPKDVLLESYEPNFLGQHFQSIPAGLHYVERMMYMDMMTYMTDDIFCKVDRASMSVGLEARMPFLDNDLVNFAWSVPIDVRICKGVGKWPLRQVLKRYVPEDLFERPKAGFGIPVGDWMRGPLRDWVEALLDEKRLKSGGYFCSDTVRKCWKEHLAGRRNLQHSLWSVLMFEAWRAEQI